MFVIAHKMFDSNLKIVLSIQNQRRVLKISRSPTPDKICLFKNPNPTVETATATIGGHLGKFSILEKTVN